LNQTTLTKNSIEISLRRFAVGTALLLIAVGTMVLIAWIYDVESLKQVVQGWPTMKVNTAIGFLLCGAALLIVLRDRSHILYAQLIGSLVGAIGVLTLYEYATAIDLGIDQLLFHESLSDAGISIPGRMGIVTAISFSIVGFVFVTLNNRSLIYVHQFILVCGVYVMLFIVNGFLFKYETIVAISPLIMVAIHTAILYILLSLALLSLTSGAGFMALFISPTSGGLILRRLYTGTIIIPFAIGWLRMLGQDAQLYSNEFGVVLFAFLVILILGIFVSWIALIIHRLDLERNSFQQELVESREHFRNLFENAPVGMCRFNLDGTGLTAVNDKLAELTGYSKEEILSNRLQILWVTPSDWETMISDVRKKGFLTDRETVIRTKNGAKKYCLTSIKLLGNDSFIEVSWIDISERKHAEEKLTGTMKELERSNKELEQFAYVASHDLQAPLQSILGNAELLEEEMGGSISASQKEYIQYIRDGLSRMQSFIKGLLTYSRAGTSKKFVPVNMYDTLEEILVTFSSVIHNKDISITFDPLPTITADALQMKQLVQNLVGNAIKFRTPNPLSIHVGVREHADEWEFMVKDNGIGIDEKYFDQIFVVFQRLHTNDAYEGTGIGLALCKKIVELHKGRMWVESELGRGTIFYFTIGKNLQ